MLYLAFFFTVTLVLYGIFALNQERNQRMKRRMSWLKESEAAAAIEPADEEPVKKKGLRVLLHKLWNPLRLQMKRRVIRKGGGNESGLELKLLQAGRPYNMGIMEFRLLKFILSIVMPVLFGGYGALLGVNFFLIILLALIGFAAGSYMPAYYLKMKAKSRAKQALRELPDVLDLLTVSLEAGLGFDSAIAKLVSKSEGVLSGEFHRCLEEMRLGKTRREALLGLKDRLLLDEIRHFVSSILQAEKLGIGMVTVLRVQSLEVRDQRKQRAEEEAMKAPIKMLFPLVLFIFPSLFIVLLGPAVIQFIQTFSK